MPVNPYSGELLAESPAAVAEVMLNRALEALEADPASAPITESYVVLGELAWDECCGTLAAAPLRTFRTGSFPNAVVDATNCDSSLLAVDIVVILLRCMPVVDAQGNVPPPSDIAAASMAASADAAIIYNALTGDLPEGWERAGVEQTIDGADGGCIVVDTRLTIGLPQSYWCVPEPEPVP